MYSGVVDQGINSPEKKLSVKVANIDSVHVDNMDVLETGQREVRKNFASKAASTYDEDLALVSQEVFDLVHD